MGGRDVDQPCAIGDQIDLDALLIDGNTDDQGPHRREQVARGAVAGVFHGDDAAGFQHHTGDEIQGLLRAVGDHDVAVAAFDPTGKRDMPGDGTAQCRQPFGLAVEPAVLGDAPQRVLGAAPPFILGELVAAGGAADKFVAQRGVACGVVHGPFRQVGGAGQVGGGLHAIRLWRPRVDESATANLAHQQAFIGQRGVGVGHGLA